MEAHGLRSTSRTLVALLVTSYAFLTSGPTEEKNFSPNWLVNLGGTWEVQPPQAGQPLPLTKATVAVHISDRLADHEAKSEPRVASSPSHGVEVPQGGGGEDNDPAPLGWKTFMEMLHSGPVAIAYEVASAGIALLSLGVLLKNAVLNYPYQLNHQLPRSYQLHHLDQSHAYQHYLLYPHYHSQPHHPS
ncbi:unnamed protein product [Lampetra fluviatilis]